MSDIIGGHRGSPCVVRTQESAKKTLGSNDEFAQLGASFVHQYPGLIGLSS